jgi:hypothetical protein
MWDLMLGWLTGDGVKPSDQSWAWWPLLPLSFQLLEQV